MAGKMLVSVLGATTVALVVGIMASALWTDQPSPEADRLPWKIQQVNGTTQVFGLRLGQSSMEQGLNNFQASAEVSLFVSPEDNYVVEAFFDDVQMMGLSAKVVLAADLAEDSLREMYARGERISTLGSGTRKVSLSEADLQMVRAAPIASITYLPKVDLQPELLERRFGAPEKRVKEADSDAVHWLYPELGLDVTLSATEKEVLQYLPPAQFDSLLTPLLNHGEELH